MLCWCASTINTFIACSDCTVLPGAIPLHKNVVVTAKIFLIKFIIASSLPWQLAHILTSAHWSQTNISTGATFHSECVIFLLPFPQHAKTLSKFKFLGERGPPNEHNFYCVWECSEKGEAGTSSVRCRNPCTHPVWLKPIMWNSTVSDH